MLASRRLQTTHAKMLSRLIDIPFKQRTFCLNNRMTQVRCFDLATRKIHSSCKSSSADSKNIIGQIQTSQYNFQTMIRCLGNITTTILVVGTLWFLKENGLKEDEIPVVGMHIDLSKNKYKGNIVSSDKYKHVGDKPKGHLSGFIVIDIEKNALYLQKGAQSSYALLSEFAISYFLSQLRPQEQPRSLILQEMRDSDAARYYTLSEMLPNTMDLEDFIMQVDWKEALRKGRLIGFEEALASDLMFANSDIKLANLLITKKRDDKDNDLYVVTAIDHEYAGQSLLSKPIFMRDPTEMLEAIRDFQPYHEEWNPIPNAGSKAVLEFRDYIIENKLLKEQNIINFYQKVSLANLNEINTILQMISKEAGTFSQAECEKLKDTIKQVQQGVCDYLEKNNMPHNENQPMNSMKV